MSQRSSAGQCVLSTEPSCSQPTLRNGFEKTQSPKSDWFHDSLTLYWFITPSVKCLYGIRTSFPKSYSLPKTTRSGIASVIKTTVNVFGLMVSPGSNELTIIRSAALYTYSCFVLVFISHMHGTTASASMCMRVAHYVRFYVPLRTCTWNGADTETKLWAACTHIWRKRGWDGIRDNDTL